MSNFSCYSALKCLGSIPKTWLNCISLHDEEVLTPDVAQGRYWESQASISPCWLWLEIACASTSGPSLTCGPNKTYRSRRCKQMNRSLGVPEAWNVILTGSEGLNTASLPNKFIGWITGFSSEGTHLLTLLRSSTMTGRTLNSGLLWRLSVTL